MTHEAAQAVRAPVPVALTGPVVPAPGQAALAVPEVRAALVEPAAREAQAVPVASWAGSARSAGPAGTSRR
jgi:hypothetical protein